jgi:hypothetical protein
MDGRKEGRKKEWVGGIMSGWVDGGTDGREERMDGWKEEMVGK